LESDGLENRNPLISKLETVSYLSRGDKKALDGLCDDIREFDAQSDVIQEGDHPIFVHLVLSGWAARYKDLPDGQRQITAFLVPGDFCDLHVTILKEMDHSILSLTPTRIARIPAALIQELPLQRPTLARALWWSTLVDEAILREWLVSAGRRNTYQALAHLFCELHARLRRVGRVASAQFELPATQDVLADALGRTPVHVNRMLQRLRKEGLIQLRGKKLTILDAQALCKTAGFDPSYLHSDQLAAAPK
jgi:CRP-like cAMP-binding protein